MPSFSGFNVFIFIADFLGNLPVFVKVSEAFCPIQPS
jgi:hypothetical protein